ncbi:hypothetical protein MICAD_1960026 [Microcystis aeruginosa PCC 7941]|nr:hypothetical protein MICAD_1960026 [Microcystis aeruginosa PCC 7941]
MPWRGNVRVLLGWQVELRFQSSLLSDLLGLLYRSFKVRRAIGQGIGLSYWLALLGLVGKMYSKIQSCWRASGRNHKDTKDTEIDHSCIT